MSQQSGEPGGFAAWQERATKRLDRANDPDVNKLSELAGLIAAGLILQRYLFQRLVEASFGHGDRPGSYAPRPDAVRD